MPKTAPQINSIRTGKERQFKTLLIGEDGALDNFRLYFVRQKGEVDVPRHKHNFDQIRMCLEGGKQNFGDGKWIAPGEIAYFPEGTPYGPEQSNTERLSITLQFGGASRNGFVSSARLQKAHGRDEGVRHLRERHLQAHRPVGAGREAQPGQLRGDLGARQQAQARLSEAALRRADPDEAGELRLGAVGGQPGVAKKQLCIFSERNLQFAIAKLEAGARGLQLSRGGIQIGFVVQGDGAVNGQALRKYSAFSGREDFALSSDEGMEVMLVGLPIFEQATQDSINQESLVAAE